MCSRIACPRCHKPSFAGCGAHVEQVLDDVPRAERCKCREEPATSREARSTKGPEVERPGVWKRLFG
jgi:hypothetical protein